MKTIQGALEIFEKETINQFVANETSDYKNGDLETVWTDEGRIKVDVDTTINSWLDTLTSIVHYDTLINFKVVTSILLKTI